MNYQNNILISNPPPPRGNNPDTQTFLWITMIIVTLLPILFFMEFTTNHLQVFHRNKQKLHVYDYIQLWKATHHTQMQMISTYANKNSRLSVANVEQALNPSPERRVCLPAVPFLTPQKTGSWFRPTGHWQFTTENMHDCGSGIWFLAGGCGALFLYIECTVRIQLNKLPE